MRTHPILATVIGLAAVVLAGAGCASEMSVSSAGAPPTGTTTTTVVSTPVVTAPIEPAGACGYCTIEGVELPPCPDRR